MNTSWARATLDWPSRKISEVEGLHYAWVIVVVLALVQVIGLSINFASGVLVQPLADPQGEFGFSLGDIGLSISLYYLSAALLSPVAGWVGDRYGGRRLMVVGALMYGTVLLGVGVVSEPWHLLLSFGVLRGTVQAIFMVPLMAVVSGWFQRRLGLGTGLLWAAGGIGPAIMSPLLAGLVTSIGWTASFFSVGAVAGLFFLSMAVLFRDRPSDLGLKPFGATASDLLYSTRNTAVAELRARVFNRSTRQTKAFWNLPTIHALGCVGHGIILLLIVQMAVDRGIDFGTAAWTLSVISLVSIPSRILAPVLAERLGSRRVMAAALLVQGLSVAYLFSAQSTWEFMLFSAIFGVGFGGEWTAYLVINRQYFGNGPMGTVYGWQMSGAFLGHALISWVAGVIVDVTGSFDIVIALSMAASLGGVLAIVMLEPTSHTLIPDWEEELPPEARSAPASSMAAD